MIHYGTRVDRYTYDEIVKFMKKTTVLLERGCMAYELVDVTYDEKREEIWLQSDEKGFYARVEFDEELYFDYKYNCLTIRG